MSGAGLGTEPACIGYARQAEITSGFPESLLPFCAIHLLDAANPSDIRQIEDMLPRRRIDILIEVDYHPVIGTQDPAREPHLGRYADRSRYGPQTAGDGHDRIGWSRRKLIGQITGSLPADAQLTQEECSGGHRQCGKRTG